MLRTLLPLVVFTMIGAFIGGCGVPGGRAAPTPTPRSPIAYVSILAIGALADADQELIRRFEEQHPRIEVARNNATSGPQQYLTSSTPPDVLTLIADGNLHTYAEQGQLQDLSDLWLREGWNDAYAERFRTLSTVNGKQYFLPAFQAWVAIYYNRQIFEAYGLEPPATWQEFLDVCETLQRNGVTPLSLGASELLARALWFDYLNIRINGPEFHARLLRGEEAFDGPEVRRVFEHWRTLLDNEYFVENPWARNRDQDIVQMLRGEVAMALDTSLFLEELVPEEARANFDYFRFPIVDPGVPVGELAPVGGYVIPAGATRGDDAVEFLAYTGSLEAQTYIAEALGSEAGVLPTHAGVDADQLPAAVQRSLNLVRGADQLAPLLVVDTPPAFVETAAGAFEGFLRNPDDIDAALVALEQARQQVLLAP